MTNTENEHRNPILVTQEVEEGKAYVVRDGELLCLDSFTLAGKVKVIEEGKETRDVVAMYEGELNELLELKSLLDIMITEYHKSKVFVNTQH